MQVTLEGKVALVTGAGAGIGRAIADAYAELGARLAIAEVDPAKCDGLRKAFPEALVVDCDVRQAGEVDALKRELEGRFDRLDVLVNNVGHHLGVFKKICDMSEGDWDTQHDINLRHMFS